MKSERALAWLESPELPNWQLEALPVYRKPHPMMISDLTGKNSLFLKQNSLFRRNNSLFCCVRNFAGSL
jgi:hypothetical protein